MPGAFSAGKYAINADYNDNNNPNLYNSSSGSGNLIVNPASPTTSVVNAALQFTRITIVPNLLALSQTEIIQVHVSGMGSGTVAFAVGGQSVSAAVDGNGNAAASLTLPLLTAALPQSITAAYSGPNSIGSATTTAYWTLLNALLPSVDTFLADGSQSVQSFLFNEPLLDLLYTSEGVLTAAIFGQDLLRWDFMFPVY